MNDIYQSAMNAFVSGNIKEAKRICKAILKQQPTAHPALHLLAMTEKRQGNYKIAVKAFNKALRLAPSTAMYWNNLGETYREMGGYDRAIECYRKAIRYRPEYAEAYSNWGAALTTLGEYTEAEQKLLRAIEIKPELVNAIYNLSVLYIDNNSLELARQALERTLSLDPNNADALVNLAYLDQQANRFDQARNHYLRAITIDSSHLKAQLNLGNLYYDNQYYDEASKCFRKATEIKPADFDAWFGLGRAHAKKVYFQDACEAFKRAITIDKQSREAILSLASATFRSGDRIGAVRILERYRSSMGEDVLLHDLSARIHLGCGEPTKAEAEARRCLELEPNNVSAYGVIVQTRHFNKGDDDLLAMRNLYEHAGLSEDERASLAFALARAVEMTGDYDAAFGYLEKANRHQRATNRGINDKTEEKIRKIKSVFTRNFIETHHKQGYEDGSPIFIIGLPRTGKTVTESLLCRHPSVAAADEFMKFIDLVEALLEDEQRESFPDGVATLSGIKFGYLGRAYIGELRKLFKTAQRVTSTLPDNAFQVGMINLCLPQAKIIWVDRELRDACLDMYRKKFEQGHKYSNDLAVLGEHAVRFNNLMAYWDQLLPGFIYKVKFEDILADTETQLRGLLDFCGLDWDDACLEEPHIAQGVFPGLTSMPTPENSTGVWKPYEKHLLPLFDALEKKYI